MTVTGLHEVDVVLVGLGATGGVVAHVLAEAGIDVLALEAGPRIGPDPGACDEIANDFRQGYARPKSVHEIPTWRPTASDHVRPAPNTILMANGVGGTSVRYTGLSWRLQPWNFRARHEVGRRYGEGAIPPGSTLVDWPLGYDDLEGHYDRVEYALGVSGAAGNVNGRKDPAGNPFEGPRRRPYPMPPLRASGWTRLMTEAAANLGWHPFPAPAAILSESYNGHDPCTYCGFCTDAVCHAGAKSSTDRDMIPAAEATGRLRIVTDARVTRVASDDRGRATGVTYVKDGVQYFQPAHVVVLGTFVYENARLLLMSTSPAFPRGLANNHGQVGLHFTSPVFVHCHGLFPGRRLNVFNGTGAQAVCVDDWNNDNFDHTGLGFVGGGLLLAWQETKPVDAANTVPPSVPRWGTAWKEWLRQNAQSVGSGLVQVECLPYEGNFLDLDPTVRDRFGAPVVRVTFDLGENERRASAFVLGQCEAWFRAAGATEFWSSAPLPCPIHPHAYGGARMGDDSRNSVVDPFGFAHEVPNLAVVGASTFPTSGSHNPTETAQALAWRTADHLVNHWAHIVG